MMLQRRFANEATVLQVSILLNLSFDTMRIFRIALSSTSWYSRRANYLLGHGIRNTEALFNYERHSGRPISIDFASRSASACQGKLTQRL